MTVLSVNLNKIALLRNARDTSIPSVIEAAKTCIEAGAQGITVHPRPDQRHIRVSDVYALKTFLDDYPDIEFNIEGNPLAGPEANGYPGFMSLIDEIRPHQCTLVPDDPLQLTSDHGWDIRQNHNVLAPFIQELAHWSIRSSVFLDADPDQVPAAAQLNIARLELYTGPYAEHFNSPNGSACLDAYVQTAQRASECGIGINAGHDLNLNNLPMLVKALPQLEEVSIGHALIADALWVGLGKTVQQYCQAIQR
jgi:pyridoxine 5-phosphate synthase